MWLAFDVWRHWSCHQIISRSFLCSIRLRPALRGQSPSYRSSLEKDESPSGVCVQNWLYHPKPMLWWTWWTCRLCIFSSGRICGHCTPRPHLQTRLGTCRKQISSTSESMIYLTDKTPREILKKVRLQVLTECLIVSKEQKNTCLGVPSWIMETSITFMPTLTREMLPMCLVFIFLRQKLGTEDMNQYLAHSMSLYLMTPCLLKTGQDRLILGAHWLASRHKNGE